MKDKTFSQKGKIMLKQLDNDIIESAIINALSDTPMSPMDIKKIMQQNLNAEGYDTNLTTSTGQDNLYLKTKSRLRNWSDKGIKCKDVGGAKFVKIESATESVIDTAPKTPKAPKAKKVVAQPIVAQPIVEETQPIVEETEAVETKPKKVKTQITETPIIQTPIIQTKEKTIMDVIEQNKSMWIERLKKEGMAYRESAFDLECASLRDIAISSQECFGKYSAKDNECSICPLSKWCSESNNKPIQVSNVQTYVVNPKVEEQKKAEAEAKAKAKADAKASQPIVSKKLTDAVSQFGKVEVEIDSEIVCSISQDKLTKGSKGYYVNTIGIVSPRCFN